MTAKTNELYVIAALLLLLAVAPFVIYPVFLMKVLCFALFACAFNLLIGYGGLLSFGHAMFFGLSAYVTAHTIKELGWPTELGLLAGTATAAVLALATGVLAIRREGIYFAMVTLALAQMVYFLCVQSPLTHGEDGIQGVPRRPLFGFIDLNQDMHLYYFVLAIFTAGFLLIYRTIHSPFGQVLKAIRENEPRAISLGYRVDQYKLMAYVISGTLAGLAGSTKVLVFKLASLTDAAWQMSGEVVLMTLLGGLGTVLGPAIGAAVIIAMQDYLKGLGDWVLVAQGVVFVITVLLFRKGIVGEIAALASRIKR